MALMATGSTTMFELWIKNVPLELFKTDPQQIQMQIAEPSLEDTHSIQHAHSGYQQ